MLILAICLLCGLETALMMVADGIKMPWWHWLVVIAIGWPVMLVKYGEPRG